MKALIWYLKQLLPLSYSTTLTDEDGCVNHLAWKMWLGRCFNVRSYITAQ